MNTILSAKIRNIIHTINRMCHFHRLFHVEPHDFVVVEIAVNMVIDSDGGGFAW